MSIERIAEALPVIAPRSEGELRDEARVGQPSRIVPRVDGEKDSTVSGEGTDAPTEQEVAQFEEKFAKIQSRGYLRELKLEYEINEGGDVIVTILDAQTEKVIRTLPPEEQREFGRRLQETIGLLFDGKA